MNWWGLSRYYNTCLGQGKTVKSLGYMVSLEVLVQGYRLDWSRMQKEVHGVRISAADMFVDSTLRYGNEVQMTVTEDRKI